MATLTLELPSQRARVAFNLRRWSEVLADPILAKVEGRVETNRFGQIIMSPPPAPTHGSYQSEIAHLLRSLLEGGRVMTECPISTADGVRAADVAWASRDSLRALGNRACFARSPEICVEVISPANSDEEMREKLALYFDAGAMEVWFCAANGTMAFHGGPNRRVTKTSALCPRFPRRVVLT